MCVISRAEAVQRSSRRWAPPQCPSCWIKVYPLQASGNDTKGPTPVLLSIRQLPHLLPCWGGEKRIGLENLKKKLSCGVGWGVKRKLMPRGRAPSGSGARMGPLLTCFYQI